MAAARVSGAVPFQVRSRPTKDPDTPVRFEPGMSREVELIAMGGDRVVFGCNGLCNGCLDEPGRREAAFAAARSLGFKGAPPASDVPEVLT